ELGVPSSDMKTFYSVRRSSIRACACGATGGACACGATELTWKTD
ncbi:hypothetical protein A2U01_0116970, partial [Trifolium medium]|nr:hypothetical protein [Trifolium medium]